MKDLIPHMHLIALCSQGMYHPLNRPPTLLHCYHSCPLLTFCLIAILKENTKDSVKTIIWTYFEWWEGKDESILAGDKKGFLGSPTEKARAWSSRCQDFIILLSCDHGRLNSLCIDLWSLDGNAVLPHGVPTGYVGDCKALGFGTPANTLIVLLLLNI